MNHREHGGTQRKFGRGPYRRFGFSYKTGQLKIVELRRRAETQLGAKFDIRDFHDAVLRDGSLPLELLDEQVGKYIAAGK